MNQEEFKKLKELRTHLAKLHQAWKDDKFADGHCKSSEGYVGVTLNYPNWFEADNFQDYIDAQPEITVEVYSYLFGPSRLHHYDSLDEALTAVKEWKYTPDSEEDF